MNYNKVITWLCVGATLAIVGLGLLVAGVLDYRAAVSTLDWPSTEATILKAEVKEVTRVSQQNAGGGTHYEDDVEYRYSAGGQERTGTRVYAGAGSRRRAQVEERVARYPVGARVPVYVDPADPASTVLERDVPKQTYYVIITGAIMSVIGVPLTLVFWRRCKV